MGDNSFCIIISHDMGDNSEENVMQTDEKKFMLHKTCSTQQDQL